MDDPPEDHYGPEADEEDQETFEDESLQVVWASWQLIRRLEAIHVRKPFAGEGTPQGPKVLIQRSSRS